MTRPKLLKNETREETLDQVAAFYGVTLLTEMRKALPKHVAATNAKDLEAIDRAMAMLAGCPAQRLRLREIERRLRKPVGDLEEANTARGFLRDEVLLLLALKVNA